MNERRLDCQLCGSNKLYEVIDLGHHPPSDAFLNEDDLNEREIFYPLRVFSCETCSLVQLNYVVDPTILFGEKYVYVSGTNIALKKHLQSIPKYLVENFGLTEKDLAIDIGSNDGTLLEGYLPYQVKVLGVDPSNVSQIAEEKGIKTIKDFFNANLAKRILDEYGKAKVITATNVFAHVKNLHSLVNGIKLLLDDKGVFLSESHYLLDMIKSLQYVETYLEHLRYYSLTSLLKLFNYFDMDVFHAERVGTHGGSIRVLACKRGAYTISDSVKAMLSEEKDINLNSRKTFEDFRRSICQHRQKLMGLLWDLKSRGHRIVGIAAPAKGNTLLNFCKIGPEILDYIVEKNSLKIGKYTPGTHIKIVDESVLFRDQPEYALLLSWDIKDVLIPKFREKGYRGRIIIPIPTPTIV